MAKTFACVAIDMKHTLKLGMLVAALAMAELVSAEPIIVFDTHRFVVANSVTHHTTAVGPWSRSVTGTNNAAQDTVISSSFTGGSGFADAIFSGGNLSTNSSASLRASFFLELISRATLDVELFAGGDSGFALALLTNTSGMRLRAAAGGSFSPNGYTQLKEEVILPRGLYEFVLRAEAGTTPGFDQNGIASFNGGLTLTPIEVVPEPGTMSLLGIGLVGAAIRRRRLNNVGRMM